MKARSKEMTERKHQFNSDIPKQVKYNENNRCINILDFALRNSHTY